MRFLVPTVLGLCLFAMPALAKFCGDDVGGADVPCACGDIVVSSLALDGDPVTAESCPADGLIVRASAATAGVTIDLRGKTLRGGEQGRAIWVVDGGPGGARIVSSGGRAAIEGFRDGISARGKRGIALVEKVDVRKTGRDGVRVHGYDFEIRDVEVTDVGRDGMFLDGEDYRCHSTRVRRSGRFGYFLNGSNAVVGRAAGGNVASDNGHAGFHAMGSGHRLNGCEATGNRKDGVNVRGVGIELNACTARGNGVDGIAGEGTAIGVYASRADENARNGLVVGGAQATDGGGNAGAGNRGEGQQRPAVQCEVGGDPCRP